MNQQLALNYLTYIEVSIAEKEWDKTALLADQAMQFAQEYSGIWAAKALVAIEMNDLTEAMENSQKAMDLNHWQGASYADAARIHSHLLYRLKRYDLLTQWYHEVPPMIQMDRQLLWFYGNALWRSGEKEQLVEIAEKGISLYPWDSRFYTLLLLSDSPNGLARFQRHWTNLENKSMDLLYPLLSQDNWDIPSFLDEWSDNPWNPILTSNLWNEGSLLIFLEKYNQELNWNHLSELQHQLPISLQGFLSDWIMVHDRELLWDYNYDGFFEGKIQPQSSMGEFILDENQDGDVEKRLVFLWNERPLEYFYTEDEKEHLIHYDNWPYISSYEVQSNDETRIYHFEDTQWLSDFAVEDRWMGWIELMIHWNTGVPESERLQRANRVEQYLSDQLFRFYYIYEGEVFWIQEDSDINGIPDRIILVRQGKAMAGLRDLNEDGWMDLYEYYQNGQWQAVMIDHSNDAMVDYQEIWEPVEIRLWMDFDLEEWDSGFINLSEPRIINPKSLSSISMDSTLFGDREYEKYWSNRWLRP